MTLGRAIMAASLLLVGAVLATPSGTGATLHSAAFSIEPDSGVAPLQVSLMNRSTDASEFRWAFGDGEASAEADPVHLYREPGLYLVTLQACDSDGCSDANAIVNVAGDDAADTGAIRSGAAVVGSIDPAGDTDLWTFVAPAGARATITMAPEPGSLVDPILRLFGPSGVLVAFNDDAAAGTDPSATITDAVLDDPGTYMVEASAFLATTGVYRLQLDLVDPDAPWARFEVAPASGVAPLTVTTTNDSINASAFLWDFGDGVTATVAAPTHTFEQAGVFDLTLSACRGAVCDTVTATVRVEADDGGSIAAGEPRQNRIDFADDIDSYTFDAPAGAEVTIDLRSTAFDALLFLRGPDGEVIATDDDGGAGRDARIATLVLQDGGTYVIEAQAFPSTGLGAYELSLELDSEPVIRARAGADVPSLVVPLEVRFSDRSLGGPTAWTWTLDGRRVSREPRFTHRFEQPGTFVVVLEACNARSCDTWQVQLALGADNDGGPVASRGSVFGQIAPPGDVDDWYVSGGTGATLSAIALADGDGLDLTLEVLDPDGASVAFDDDGGGDLNPQIVLALPRSGTYTLRVATFDDSLGGGYRLEVDLRAPPGTSDQVEALQAGWNLMSWPLASGIEAVLAAIVGDVDAIYAWDALGGAFLVFDPTLPPALNSLRQVDGGAGLWIRMTGPGVWQPPPPERTVFELRAGFNLASWASRDVSSADVAFAPIGHTLVAVYAWDAIAQAFLVYRPLRPTVFNTLQQLTPGQGLWIQVDDDVRWDPPAP